MNRETGERNISIEGFVAEGFEPVREADAAPAGNGPGPEPESVSERAAGSDSALR